MPADDLPEIVFADGEEFRAWLAEHHATAPGVLAKVAKKHTGIRTMTWDEGVEAALCFGWIDGVRRGVDADWYVQRYTPRTKRSTWSKKNVDRVARLIADGLMTPAGMAEVERAKADGRWDAAYDSPRNAKVPPDLQAALDASPAAAATFAALSASARYSILHPLMTAVKPETRQRRLDRFVAMLERGDKPG